MCLDCCYMYEDWFWSLVFDWLHQKIYLYFDCLRTHDVVVLQGTDIVSTVDTVETVMLFPYGAPSIDFSLVTLPK